MTWDAPAVVLVIGAFGAMLVTIIGSVFTGIMAYKSNVQSTENGHKSDTIIQKAEAIHVLTNSNLSRVTDALNTANAKIEGLERSMALMVEAKGLADKLIDRGLTRAGDDEPVPVEVVNTPLTVATEPKKRT